MSVFITSLSDNIRPSKSALKKWSTTSINTRHADALIIDLSSDLGAQWNQRHRSKLQSPPSFPTRSAVRSSTTHGPSAATWTSTWSRSRWWRERETRKLQGKFNVAQILARVFCSCDRSHWICASTARTSAQWMLRRSERYCRRQPKSITGALSTIFRATASSSTSTSMSDESTVSEEGPNESQKELDLTLRLGRWDLFCLIH